MNKIRRYRIFLEDRCLVGGGYGKCFILKEYIYSIPSMGFMGDEAECQYDRIYQPIAANPVLSVLKKYKRLLERVCPTGLFIEENMVRK